MKLKALSEEELAEVRRLNEETYRRAFGRSMAEAQHERATKKRSEGWEQMQLAKWMIEHYPKVRFYSTLNGFYLGHQYNYVHAIQWYDIEDPTGETGWRGFPDFFVYASRGKYSQLVLELKKTGTKLGNDKHTRRQQDWLDYFRDNCNACTDFAIGLEDAKWLIKRYMKYGKIT